MICITTETQGYILSVVYIINTTFAIERGKRVMCPASAKTVDVLAVRYVKQGIEDAGFRAGSPIICIFLLLTLFYFSDGTGNIRGTERRCRLIRSDIWRICHERCCRYRPFRVSVRSFIFLHKDT